jgi:hypothetical protein
MLQRSWIRFVLPLAIVAALVAPVWAQEAEEEEGEEEEEEEADEAPYGLGPFEVAPGPLYGNVGAPRSAVPETRFGVLLDWRMVSDSAPGGEVSGHELGLLLEGHIELFDVVEVGVDAEVLQYASVSAPTGTAGADYTEFGFVTPRVKIAIARGDMYTLSFGLGVLLPTATGSAYSATTPIGFDPGLYFGLRFLDMVSINLSVPVVLDVRIPDSGDTAINTFLTPSAGVTVMPIDFIGGFVDMQFRIWADAPDGAEYLNAMNLIVGARSNFLPWMMGEIGAIIPLAGDMADQFASNFGLGIRLVATPDFL